MNVVSFRASLGNAAPPSGLSGPLRALWWAAKDDWEQAHRIVMDDASREAAWVHAYLHRVEGDAANARYWYRQAQRPESREALAIEWNGIVTALLDAAL
jgi:hypothetical protein